MIDTDFVSERVSKYFREDEINCATAALKVLAEAFDYTLSYQVTDSALGLNGAGQYGAQCGLVEGVLMFLGIIGRERHIPDETIGEWCKEYAQVFEQKHGTLLCREIRPEGFGDEVPEHLCESRTTEAIVFAVKYVAGKLSAK